MIRENYWTIEEIRRQAEVLRGTTAPSKVFKSVYYLNTYLKTWETANIWIDGDRIVYVGDQLPEKTDERTEVIDCSGLTAVPGYIEPHVHPGQLYNPQSLAEYAAPLGTTTLICDNAIFFRCLEDEPAFRIIEQLDRLPETFYWWCRYDSQSEVRDSVFVTDRIERWLRHPLVVQGGELTGWPQVIHGNNQMLSWMRETKCLRKPIESHLPGASERTLTQLKLFGADCDHEAMTGDEAIRRLRLGYTVSLRYSSIRPDLPEILKQLVKKGLHHFEHVYMTMDGATPAFLKDGLCDRLIQIALEAGIEAEDAYMMASSNIAAHYHFDDRTGHIAPGRVANINFLSSPAEPRPISVLSRGKWVCRNGKKVLEAFSAYDLADHLKSLQINVQLEPDMLRSPSNIGIEMVNDVITRPFELETREQLPDDVHYLTLIDKNGNWMVRSFLRGFARHLSGFAGSFTATGDILLIGKDREDMIAALNRLKLLGGGLVIADHGKTVAELPLPLLSCMSGRPMGPLADEAELFEEKLRSAGYHFGDPFFSLLFLSSTHLPYIRITPKGMYDVMRRSIIRTDKGEGSHDS